MDHSTSSSCSSPSSHNQNWLAFSLSNNSNSHHQFSLFQPSLFNSGGHVDQENGSSGGACTDQLPVVLSGPKLENFLGGSSSSPPPPPQFDSTNIGAHHNQGMMISSSPITIPNVDHVYDDSELKTLAAAGFLRGFSATEQPSSGSSDKQLAAAPPAKKTAETFGQRTSIFRGVTRHRWTGRYEAHLWDNSCRREGQSRKGRQVYLGGYDKEEKAARAYDLAALKYWGPTTTTNFPVLDYEKEIEEMKHMSRQEFVASLRRKSSGFSRGASMYRGVTRHHQHGRWQARIGRVAGNKDLYLGTFSTQEEAAEAYDIAAIKFRGLNAVTNFDMSRYDVKSIATSNLPIGGATNKSKTSSESQSENKSIDAVQSSDDNKKDHISCATSTPFPPQNSAPTISFGLPTKQDQSSSLWAALGYQNPTITSTARNPSSGITLFQDSNNTSGTTALQVATPYAMEFPCNANIIGNNEGFFNDINAGYYSPRQDNNTTTSPSGTTTTSDENWAMPSPLYRPAKPSLSSFQTPIFGME